MRRPVTQCTPATKSNQATPRARIEAQCHGAAPRQREPRLVPNGFFLPRGGGKFELLHLLVSSHLKPKKSIRAKTPARFDRGTIFSESSGRGRNTGRISIFGHRVSILRRSSLDFLVPPRSYILSKLLRKNTGRISLTSEKEARDGTVSL